MLVPGAGRGPVDRDVGLAVAVVVAGHRDVAGASEGPDNVADRAQLQVPRPRRGPVDADVGLPVAVVVTRHRDVARHAVGPGPVAPTAQTHPPRGVGPEHADVGPAVAVVVAGRKVANDRRLVGGVAGAGDRRVVGVAAVGGHIAIRPGSRGDKRLGLVGTISGDGDGRFEQRRLRTGGIVGTVQIEGQDAGRVEAAGQGGPVGDCAAHHDGRRSGGDQRRLDPHRRNGGAEAGGGRTVGVGGDRRRHLSSLDAGARVGVERRHLEHGEGQVDLADGGRGCRRAQDDRAVGRELELALGGVDDGEREGLAGAGTTGGADRRADLEYAGIPAARRAIGGGDQHTARRNEGHRGDGHVAAVFR